MEDIITNPWFIGVAGTLISSAVIAIIQFLWNKRKNKEYFYQVDKANTELLIAFRTMLVEEGVPTLAMFNSFRDSLSLKYKINIPDLMTPAALRNDLTRDVLSNSFMNNSMKINLCRIIETSFIEIKDKSPNLIENVLKKQSLLHSEQLINQSRLLRIMFLAFTGMMLTMGALLLSVEDVYDKNNDIYIYVLLGVSFGLIITISRLYYKYLKKASNISKFANNIQRENQSLIDKNEILIDELEQQLPPNNHTAPIHENPADEV